MGNFRTTLIQLSQDKVIDRADLAHLRQIGQSAPKGSAEAQMAGQVLGFLDEHSKAIQIRYGIPGQTLEFDFTPAYAESDLIPGDNPRDRLSQVAQGDTLPETNDEHQRCGAASLLNAWLLLGGSFDEASRKLGLPAGEMSYANLHRAQEALFDQSNHDGGGGLSSSFSYTHRGSAILSVELSGEVSTALNKLGLRGTPLLGARVESMHQRQAAVDAFWQTHPEGVLLTGVYLDTGTGEIRSPSAAWPQNHFVTVFKDRSGHAMLDTGASDNGLGNSLHSLSPDQLAGFVYQSSGHVIGVTK